MQTWRQLNCNFFGVAWPNQCCKAVFFFFFLSRLFASARRHRVCGDTGAGLCISLTAKFLNEAREMQTRRHGRVCGEAGAGFYISLLDASGSRTETARCRPGMTGGRRSMGFHLRCGVPGQSSWPGSRTKPRRCRAGSNYKLYFLGGRTAGLVLQGHDEAAPRGTQETWVGALFVCARDAERTNCAGAAAGGLLHRVPRREEELE